jgi:hypothetical protein
MMAAWTPPRLDRIGAVDELEIATSRPDGTLRRYTLIWVVRVANDLYVRSYRGKDGNWYQAVLRRPHGRIRVGGVEHDVTFRSAADADQGAIDAAYRSKYRRSPYVDAMLTPSARVTTLRLNVA